MKRKTITETMKFLKDNPEYGRSFYEYFEDMRDELIAEQFRRSDPQYHKQCQHSAAFIQDKILGDFGLKSLSRRD